MHISVYAKLFELLSGLEKGELVETWAVIINNFVTNLIGTEDN